MQLIRPAIECDVEVEGLVRITKRGKRVWRKVIVVSLNTEGETAGRCERRLLVVLGSCCDSS
jgi:hypothetical protein